MKIRPWATVVSAVVLTVSIVRSSPATTVANGASSLDNRRLLHPLSKTRHWVRFVSRADERLILAGMGLVERYDAPNAPDRAIDGVALRLYDARSGTWSDYWSTAGDGTFSIPAVGGFKNGVGRFYDRETIAGRPVTVRFTWSRADAAHCRWVQAFSIDGGTTWQDNWIMDFSRR